MISLYGWQISYINSLPNDKILFWNKLNAFVEDKMNLNERLKLVSGRVENFVGKGENNGYQHFLLSPQFFPNLSLSMFLKGFFLRVVKSRIVW